MHCELNFEISEKYLLGPHWDMEEDQVDLLAFLWV